jgi:hypothetical protein
MTTNAVAAANNTRLPAGNGRIILIMMPLPGSMERNATDGPADLEESDR